MKKILTMTAAVAALLLNAACSRETFFEDGTDKLSARTLLTAEAPASKTVLDGTRVCWTDNDRINVNGAASDALALDVPATSAPFAFSTSLSFRCSARSSILSL